MCSVRVVRVGTNGGFEDFIRGLVINNPRAPRSVASTFGLSCTRLQVVRIRQDARENFRLNGRDWISRGTRRGNVYGGETAVPESGPALAMQLNCGRQQHAANAVAPRSRGRAAPRLITADQPQCASKWLVRSVAACPATICVIGLVCHRAVRDGQGVAGNLQICSSHCYDAFSSAIQALLELQPSRKKALGSRCPKRDGAGRLERSDGLFQARFQALSH